VGAGLAVGPLQQGLEGGGIAIQATDDIKGVRLKLGRLGSASGRYR
jgi:hypothetical protein